jgi:hypothetical protein
MLRVVVLLLACLAAAGCGKGAPADDGAEEGAAAQNGTLPDEVGTFRHEGQTPVVVIGHVTFAVVGDRVGELQDGKRYMLSLAREEGQVEGFNVRKLVDFRKVQKLLGTLADDAQDPALAQLRSLHDRSYVLTGESVAAFKETRAGLPTHDYAKTLFRVNVVAELRGSSRYVWLDYEPVPLYGCKESDAPHVHLDLVNVKPDDSLLDGFVATQMGPEAQLGAHAECTRDGAGYKCALDDLSGPWGTARFVPAGGTFELVVERNDAAHTRVGFGCTSTDRASLAAESED